VLENPEILIHQKKISAMKVSVTAIWCRPKNYARRHPVDCQIVDEE
jgi:hypothetical protein